MVRIKGLELSFQDLGFRALGIQGRAKFSRFRA